MFPSSSLSERECDAIDRHVAAGLRDGVRVVQPRGMFSVFYEGSGRLWVHRDNPRKQTLQELYFYSSHSTLGTMTASHPVKLWDLRRRLTGREMARAQGFPDTMILPTPVSVQHKLFGNAVCVPCAAFAIEKTLDRGRPSSSSATLRHIDLCAGVGGFGFALSAVVPNSTTIAFSEIQPHAVQCFAQNFPDATPLGDATHVEDWPECELLTAGFPCQPFSRSNSRVRRGTHRSLDFVDVVSRAVKSSNARFVVLENVCTFPTVGKPQYDRLMDTLHSLEFHTDQAVLDAHDWGVPQHRKRLYIVASRTTVPHLPSLPDQPVAPRIVRDILEDLLLSPRQCGEAMTSAKTDSTAAATEVASKKRTSRT